MVEAGSRPVVVVIEDDPDLRALVCTVLEQDGLEAVAAADGESGLAAVREHQPLVTTVDVSLPDMDGFAVAAALREVSTTRILMLTGDPDVVERLEGTADDHLLKPFRPRELRARVEALARPTD